MSFFPACEQKERVISGVSLKSGDHKENVVFFPFKFQCISHFNHFKAIVVAVCMYVYIYIYISSYFVIYGFEPRVCKRVSHTEW